MNCGWDRNRRSSLLSVASTRTHVSPVFSGLSRGKKMKELLWLPGRYFFLGIQFHLEFKSRP
jgi:CTP synthase (UTP-ammonia lyase)